MRILYVTTLSTTIKAFLIPHIRDQISCGHTVDVACNLVSDVRDELSSIGSKVFDISFSRNPFSVDNLSAFKEVKSLMKDGKYDIVHVHTPIASAVTRLASKNLNIRVIYTAHGFHFYQGAPLLNWLLYYPIEKYLSKFTDVLITINEEDYEFSNRKLKAKTIKYLPGVGVNTEIFHPVIPSEKASLRKQYGYDNETFIIIIVGELNKNKNQISVLNALSSIEHKNFKLLIVGEGGNAFNLKQATLKNGIENNVEFLGYRSDVNRLLQISDLLISASYREGLPVNIIEAISTNIGVISTDIRGSRDLVKGYPFGVVIDNQEELYIKEIENYMAAHDFIKSDKCQDYNNKFSLDNILKQQRKIVSELVHNIDRKNNNFTDEY